MCAPWQRFFTGSIECANRGGRDAVLSVEPLEDRNLLAIDFVAGPLQAPLINQPDRALGITSNVTEPAVTINNTDPGNLAISNQSNLILTTDAGATFTAPVNFNNLLPAGSVSNGDTDTAFDSQGRLFWTNLVRPAAGRNVGITQINPTTGG